MVFCEGKNSEPDYVKGIRKLPHIADSTALSIQIDPTQGVPLTLVRAAVTAAKDPEIDSCWCLFDVEWPKHHPNLRQAIDLAQAHGINLAISNPCFEIWLVLHHTDHRAFIETEHATKLSQNLDSRAGKSIDTVGYMPHRHEAVRRARALDRHHVGNGTEFPNDNPSSGMHRFVAALDPDAGQMSRRSRNPTGPRR